MFGVYFDSCGCYSKDENYRNFDNMENAISYAEELANNEDLTCEETYVVVNENVNTCIYIAG